MLARPSPFTPRHLKARTPSQHTLRHETGELKHCWGETLKAGPLMHTINWYVTYLYLPRSQGEIFVRDFPKILTIEGQPTMHLHISPMPQNSLSKILFAKINCLTGSSCQRGCVENQGHHDPDWPHHEAADTWDLQAVEWRPRNTSLLFIATCEPLDGKKGAAIALHRFAPLLPLSFDMWPWPWPCLRGGTAQRMKRCRNY